MKKTLARTIFVLMAIALLAGLAFAQSTYVEPPEPEPDVPDDWIKLEFLDKHEIFLSLDNPEEILNADIPVEYEPYELSWYSEDQSVATVTTMSAARVTRQGIGGTWIIAQVDTEDATYYEHHFGRFWGRERIRSWITETMSQYPACHMKAFPVTWYSIDVKKGWVFCEVMNRMEDLGDNRIHQEPNLTVLHYAGNGLFSYEEDAYNPANMGRMMKEWIEARRNRQAADAAAAGAE